MKTILLMKPTIISAGFVYNVENTRYPIPRSSAKGHNINFIMMCANHFSGQCIVTITTEKAMANDGWPTATHNKPGGGKNVEEFEFERKKKECRCRMVMQNNEMKETRSNAPNFPVI